MYQNERANDQLEALRTLLDGWQAHMWTALPAIIQSVDWEKMTCVIAPAVKGRQFMPDATTKDIAISLCTEVPMIFPTGGGFTLTFPVAAGDECLAIFASRDISVWWQSGGIQPQQDLRMHDLSDAFALLGPRSVPRALENISTTTVQLRSDDGETFVEIDGDKQITLKAPTKIILDTPEVHVTGNVTVDGEIVAEDEVTGNDIHLSTHIHGGVEAGSDDSEGPENP